MKRVALAWLVMVACDDTPALPPGTDAADATGADVDIGEPPVDCLALTLDDFRVNVWGPVFEAHGCIVCHRPRGLAGQSDLVLVGGDDDATVSQDLDVIRAVALKDFDGESVLLLRPTGRYPEGHVGGDPIALDSPEYAALLRFVRAAEHCPTGGAAPTGHAVTPHR